MTDDLEHDRLVQAMNVLAEGGDVSSYLLTVAEWHSVQALGERVNRLETENAHLRAAIEQVLNDSESQPGGWGPDVTMVAVLRAALEKKASLFAAALAAERAAHSDDNQRLYGMAVEAAREMLDEANARAERAEQQLADAQAKLTQAVAERDELLIYKRVVEVNGITQYDQTGSAWELIQQLREQLVAEQAARARAEAALQIVAANNHRDAGGPLGCSYCGWRPADGHYADCVVKAALVDEEASDGC